jgi:hypothetical protein
MRTRPPFSLTESALLIFVLLATTVISVASGQVANNWINPASARWDSTSSWSLANLPGANQVVSITNGGYKAVNIDSLTAANYPSAMSVSNLAISAPTGALSTLLLNYPGLSVPLHILGGCEVNTNGTLQNLFGHLQVDGGDGRDFHLIGRGQYIQEGGQLVVNAPFNVFDGTANCTNGNTTLGPLTIGTANPGGGVIQDGGNVATSFLQVNSGVYLLVRGTLYMINGGSLVRGYYAQYGGTNFGSLTVSVGECELYNGLMHGDVLAIGAQGEMRQRGGVVEMQSINISGGNYYPDYFPSFPPYTLEHGELHCGDLSITHNGLLEQQSGIMVLTNHFDLHGQQFVFPDSTNTEYADYRLTGGLLTAPSLSLGPFAI